MQRLHLALWIVSAFLASNALAADEAAPDPVAEVRACAARNMPKSTLDLRATFTKIDRVGGERLSRAKVLGKKLEDGLRRIVLRFDKPKDVRGTAMLMIENPNGPSDFYVYSPDERRTRRVAGRSGGGGLFGTDFSYDDFENWRGFSSQTSVERLPDAVEAGRPVYVLAGKPVAAEGSTYERVVTYFDRETCVALRIDSFEAGGKLRKVLRADPASVKTTGDVSIATVIDLEDVIDGTKTHVAIEKIQLDVDLPDRMFRQQDLGSGE